MPDGHMLDGNALAGPMAAAFGADMTDAMARCAGCGLVGPIAETMVYGHPTAEQGGGYVARCPGCDNVLMTMVMASDRTFVGLPGTAFIELR